MLGLYFSWSLNTPAGGTIVLVATSLFLLAWLGAPKHGLLARLFKRSDEVAEVENVVVEHIVNAATEVADAGSSNEPSVEQPTSNKDVQKEEVSA